MRPMISLSMQAPIVLNSSEPWEQFENLCGSELYIIAMFLLILKQAVDVETYI